MRFSHSLLTATCLISCSSSLNASRLIQQSDISGTSHIEEVRFQKGIFTVTNTFGNTTDVAVEHVKELKCLSDEQIHHVFSDPRVSLQIRSFGSEESPAYLLSLMFKLLGGKGITDANIDAYKIRVSDAEARANGAAQATVQRPSAVASRTASASEPVGGGAAPAASVPVPTPAPASRPASGLGLHLTSGRVTSAPSSRPSGASTAPAAAAAAGSRPASDPALEARVAALERAEAERREGDLPGGKCPASIGSSLCKGGVVFIGGQVGKAIGLATGPIGNAVGAPVLAAIGGAATAEYYSDRICNPNNYPSSIHPVLKEAAIRESGATEGVYDHTPNRDSGSSFVAKGSFTPDTPGYYVVNDSYRAAGYTTVAPVPAVASASQRGGPGSTVLRDAGGSSGGDSGGGFSFAYDHDAGGFVVPSGSDSGTDWWK